MNVGELKEKVFTAMTEEFTKSGQVSWAPEGFVSVGFKDVSLVTIALTRLYKEGRVECREEIGCTECEASLWHDKPHGFDEEFKRRGTFECQRCDAVIEDRLEPSRWYSFSLLDETRKELSAQAVDLRLEQIAALEHEQWAHWTQYMLDELHCLVGVEIEDLDCVQRWRRQIETPYVELSEEEKESDRVWARKVTAMMEKGND